MWENAAAVWETRPRSKGLRAQFAWLWLVIRQLCIRNVSWLLSAGIHLVVLLSIAGFAWHAGHGNQAISVDSTLGETLAETAFENVGVDAIEMGGGGDPLDSVAEEARSAQDAALAASFRDFPRIDGDNLGGKGSGGEGGGAGGGTGTGIGPGIGAGFFGTKGAGKSFVYVVDMSGSMHGLRFERAKKELVRSINKLGPEQKFYVYFFNDRTYPLFDPKPANGMIPGNPSNKQRATRWINTRQAESTTNPNYALQQALEMKPEVIFLLTDGELDEPEEVRHMIRRFNKTNVVIHTIAFENEDGGTTLEAIANENNGVYRFVK
ncbi:MAG: VWA domain-containing protein [Planctomycetia bacterium]|nr:VWA domain-containing protein [Planctomycetia bacterium]